MKFLTFLPTIESGRHSAVRCVPQAWTFENFAGIRCSICDLQDQVLADWVGEILMRLGKHDKSAGSTDNAGDVIEVQVFIRREALRARRVIHDR